MEQDKLQQLLSKELTAQDTKIVKNYRKTFLKGVKFETLSKIRKWVANKHFMPRLSLRVNGLVGTKDFWTKFLQDEDLFEMLKEAQQAEVAKKQTVEA